MALLLMAAFLMNGERLLLAPFTPVPSVPLVIVMIEIGTRAGSMQPDTAAALGAAVTAL